MRSIVVLQTGRMGDMVQTLPILRRLRRAHPGSEITLAGLDGFASVLGPCGYVDNLVPLPERASEGLPDVRAGTEARTSPFPDLDPALRGNHDLLVNLSSDPGAAIHCREISAARKSGRIQTYDGELRLLGPWAKYLVALVSSRVDNLFNLVDIQMGMAGLAPGPEPHSLPVPAARRLEAAELLRSAGIRGTGKIIAIQSGASALHRAWSPEDFAAVAIGLMADGYAEIVLLGDEAERERVRRLAERIGLPLADLSGKTDLARLPAVVQACDLLISNDTGTIHVAAAVGTPTLGLYFSTAYHAETAPYGAGHAVLQVEIPCAPCNASSICPVQLCRSHLAPDAVLEAARWLLDGGSRSRPPRERENVSLYLSRFLDNGTLLYMPARPEKASAHFQAGLLGRLMWEEELGLRPDPVVRELWLRMRAAGLGEGRVRNLSADLAALSEPLRTGLDLAGTLRAEFASASPRKERILSLHESLARLATDLTAAGREAGLWGRFLQYEMMDMEYAAYPGLADILEAKYRHLAEWARRFEQPLMRLT